MKEKREHLLLLNILYVTLLFETVFPPAFSEPVEDKQALLDFYNNIIHSPSLNWNATTSLCKDWAGVYCNSDQSRVIAVRLPGARLLGPIPNNTISRLSGLEILSLRLNDISGPFPSDFSKLENLNSIYLQFNKISGPLPPDFSVWKNLTILDLSNNAFNGTIPSSISNLTHLQTLNLANNSLTGEIPDLNITSLQKLDLSNNNLTGNVPKSLQRFPSLVFSGNNLTLHQSDLSPASEKSKKLSESAILGIILGACVSVFALAAVVMIFSSPSAETENTAVSKPKNKEASSNKKTSEMEDKKNNLTFFQGSRLAFNLDDLLSSSAEILGKGLLGTSYKATLGDGTTVVVKRIKEVNISRREFEHQMGIVGKLQHENVVAPRAYYYSKEEKLIVYDFYQHGSVSIMLYDKRGEGRIPLDWKTRIRIAIGAAKGIAYIHSELGGKLVYGNIKASNVFLNSGGYGCVSDIGWVTLASQTAPHERRIAGYMAPEVRDARKASHASDVYSFGVFLLELLTGKSPVLGRGGEEVVNLVRWVNSVVREEWTAEVFDVELLRYANIEEELVEMLHIALSCAVRGPENRPNMADVAARIEQVGSQGNPGNQPSSESVSEYSTPPRVTVTEIGSTSDTR